MKSLDDSVELCTDNWIFSAYENIGRGEVLGAKWTDIDLGTLSWSKLPSSPNSENIIKRH
jgi:hypothetical protein